jgi:hypothetical protein
MDDLVMLIVNAVGDEAGVPLVEGCDLPILQDTETEDVFGLYDAYDYDVFVVDREGFVGYAGTGIHPLDDPDGLLETILGFR